MPLEENAKIVLGQAYNDSAENEESKTQDNDELENKTESELERKTESEKSSQEMQESKEQAEVEKAPPDIKLDDEAATIDGKQILDEVSFVLKKIEESGEAYQNLEQKVIQTLRENSNFQIQVRQNMQKELEDAKKKLSGDIFIPLLKEIAELYVEWQDVLCDLEDGVAKRKVQGIFEVLEEILEEYGCEFGTSEIDSKRRTKYSKLKNKVATGIKEKHETVAQSHNSWIVKEPFVLYPEYVDIYVYDASLSEELNDSTENDNINNQEEE
jgi:hypothetical protein